MKNRERRIGGEIRAAGGGDTEPTRLVGHAALFDVRSQDLGGFVEQIAAGAFAESIRRDDVRALINHDSNLVLGRNVAGTLDLAEDERGLAFEIRPPNTSYARDLIESVARGDISQNSFGFIVEEDAWEDVDSASPLRTLKRVRLFDVSPVTYPAYTETEVALRTLEHLQAQLPAPVDESTRRALRHSLHRAELAAAR